MTYEPFLLQSFSKKFSFDHSALKEPKKKKNDFILALLVLVSNDTTNNY